jgi:hypothetical protein
VTRWILGDLRTGRRILDLPVLKGTWEDRLDVAETITVTVDMQDPDILALNLRNAAARAKTFLGVVENGVIVAAGPIWTHHYSRDDATLELGAKGLASVFDHRLDSSAAGDDDFGDAVDGPGPVGPVRRRSRTRQ